MRDEVFEEEQEHLSEVYAKLLESNTRLSQRLEKTKKDAAQDIAQMRDESSLDSMQDIHTESMAELMAINSLIDTYSRTSSIVESELKKNELLLKQPYFAKVQLEYPKMHKTRDIYLGSVGAADENMRHFIIDWRSPVAEVYYNQASGPTSYEADGRVIEVDLKVRRQFDIDRDVLNACFDTTVAIEDPLLLQSLAKRHTEKLQAITATIQKEQNEVVRHADVEALLVDGVAGSGKTSVLLQRIAYLFYQQRDTLDPSQVYLFTPNPMFECYIDEVLPNMGEANPHVLTWESFVEMLGIGDRGLGEDTDIEVLECIEESLETLKFQPRDFKDVCVEDRVLVKARVVASLAKKHERIPAGPRLVAVMADELHERIEKRIAGMAKDPDIQDEMCSLDADEQVRLFGHVLDVSDEEGIVACAERYVESRYAQAHERIDDFSWIRFDRIGMRMLGSSDLNALELMYVRFVVAADTCPKARYVMVDEVQDYSLAQLAALERYFSRAHFLLLGDANQAIFEGTASFGDIAGLFERRRGSVESCHLMTSYRSSPEITELFCSLIDDGGARQNAGQSGSSVKAHFQCARVAGGDGADAAGGTSADEERETAGGTDAGGFRIASVQRSGVEPVIAAYPHADHMRNVLRGHVRTSYEDYALTAIITSDRGILKWVSKYLQVEVRILHQDDSLPGEGVVLLDLALAKGLEFDHVIIPDASDKTYPDTPLSRRRLYTAISRATHKVTLLAQGRLSPLLKATEEA